MKIFLNWGHMVVLFLIIFLFIIAFYRADFIKVKTYKAEDFGIKTEESALDTDNDGVEDYTDILNGAREFVSKNPKYKSKYYEGGYPTDGYYVCTDVIWYALSKAGYDLKTLLDEDIKNNQSDYDITTIDPNIDFRRVKNIKVFLDKYALKLTLDPTEIEKWQGGDIVTYPNHIAIVSDKRNKEGIPFIIHHDGGLKYEENALEEKTITGHYRFTLHDVNE